MLPIPKCLARFEGKLCGGERKGKERKTGKKKNKEVRENTPQINSSVLERRAASSYSCRSTTACHCAKQISNRLVHVTKRFVEKPDRWRPVSKVTRAQSAGPFVITWIA